MKNSKVSRRGYSSTLGLRLWEFTGTSLLTMFVWVFLIIFLSPLSYMVVTSLKSADEFRDRNAPLLPAERLTYKYNGKTYDLYKVPTADGVVHNWALVQPSRLSSKFIDPAHPEQGLIDWNGSWRALPGVFRYRIYWNNYPDLWKAVNYPLYLKNTAIIVVIGEIGILLSSIAVAYGFSRFRIPGGKFLFFLLIATIVIPDSITLVPTFVIFSKVFHWWGTRYPLIVPAFFGSAIYIFLLRQNFKSIPRDLDEAAMLDGAGPLRTLISIVIPQAIPTITTVALLFFFNTWNELRTSSLYLGIAPRLQTMAFTGVPGAGYGFTPEMLQTSAMILMAVPLLVLFLSQRFFMQDMVVTAIEK
jgi:multiple sugar transport system permease protein